MKPGKEAVLSEFVEGVGVAAEAEGLPRIAGRVMAFLMAHGGTHSFAELAELLGVSRASISTNTRLLEGLGIIQRVGKPGDRQDYYRITEDPYGRLIEGQVQRMQRMEQVVIETRQQLPANDPARRRLEEMQRFYEYAIRNTRKFLEGWRAHRSA